MKNMLNQYKKNKNSKPGITLGHLKKLIRESVRENLIENNAFEPYKKAFDNFPNMALNFKDRGSGILTFDIYQVNESGSEEVIASAVLDKLTGDSYSTIDPEGFEEVETRQCIPDTYAATTLYTSVGKQSKGLSKLLIDMLFFKLGEMGAGLTTDIDSGNTPIVSFMIRSMLNSHPEYVKRTTAAGNDKMDFFNMTSDPDDDCWSEWMEEWTPRSAYATFDMLVKDKKRTRKEAEKQILDFASNTSNEFSFGTLSSWKREGWESLRPVWEKLTSNHQAILTNNPYQSQRAFDRQRADGFDAALWHTPTQQDIDNGKFFRLFKHDDD